MSSLNNIKNLLKSASETFDPEEQDNNIEESLKNLNLVGPKSDGLQDDEVRALLAYPFLNRMVSPSGLERAALRDFSDTYRPDHYFSFENWNRNKTVQRYKKLLRQLDDINEYRSSPLSRLSFEELDRIANLNQKNRKKWVNSRLSNNLMDHGKNDRYLLNAHIQAMSRAAQAELKRRENMGEV